MRFSYFAPLISLAAAIACTGPAEIDLVKNDADFWTWFGENEWKFYSMDSENVKERERLFDLLSGQLDALNPDLTFEFGPILQDGTREFVISAGGIKEAFPAVESLHASAPKLERWQITKFRPRRDRQLPIEIYGLEIDPKDVHYTLFRDGEKIGIMLFHANYPPDDAGRFGQAFYLLLDSALGEYDVETKVGFIEFDSPANEHFNADQTLIGLPEHFDEAWGSLSDRG